jgi:uncharacterized delta-60 repeat protein
MGKNCHKSLSCFYTPINMKHALAVLLVLCSCYHILAQSFTLNPDFGIGGGTLINFHERTYDNFIALGINVTHDGHVLVGGYVNTDAALNTIGPDGKDDPGFGIKGYSFYDFGSWSSNWIQDILTTPDGKTILIGEQAPCASLQDTYWTDRGATVMRLLPDGTPDPTFGTRGKAFCFYPNSEFNVFSGLVQPDGKVVVAGRSSDLLSIDIWTRVLLARFNANGSIDSSFGTKGICLVPQYSGFNWRQYTGKSSIALQPDGKIILGDITSEQIFINGGTAVNASPAVYRITANGTMDSTFGINGMFFNRFGFDSYGINGLLVQTDGRIVVSANLIDVNSGLPWGWLLFRLDSSGNKIDSGFAQHGLFLLTPDSAGTNAGWKTAAAGSIAGTADGSIIVSAVHGTANSGLLDVFRLTPAGNFDTSFANGSTIYTQSMPQNHFLYYSKIVRDTAGNLAVMGYSGTQATPPALDPIGHIVVRLTKDGVPMRTFNGTGYLRYYGGQDTTTTTWFNYGSDDELRAITELSSGRILLAGQVATSGGTVRENAVVALTAKGKIDSSFGINGRVVPLTTMAIPPPVRTLYRLDDDEVLTNRDDQTLYKLDSNGKVDANWGQGGFVALNNGTMQLRAVMEQPDKKILVVSDAQLSRLNPDGSFDNTFANHGTLSLNYYLGVSARAIRLQPDGMIVLALNAIASPSLLYLYRCAASGNPDNSFGIAGNGYAQVEIDVPAAYELPYTNTFEDFQVLPNGKFIVLSMKDRNYGIGYVAAGATFPALYQQITATGVHFRDFMIFRLTSDGKIDSSFGGYPVPSVYKGASYLSLPYLENIPATISIDTSSGDLLLSGIFNRGTGWDAGFVTLKADGSYDTTCLVPGSATVGMDDIVRTSRTNLGDLPLLTLPLADGSYLVAGTQDGQGPDFFVKDVYPPNKPGAIFTNVNVTQDTACLKADLSWQTNLECGVDSFFIEYSQNGVSFTRLNSIRANGQQNYRLSPLTANYGPNYYRVRAVASGVPYGASDIKELFIDNNEVAQLGWNGIQENQIDTLFDITLQWSTTAEDGAASFQLQQSMDTVNFKTIETITSDNISSGASYSSEVNHLQPGKYYFRILASGTDCRSTTGPLLDVSLILKKDSCTDNLLAWPNPVHGELTVQIPGCQTGDLYIFDIQGQVIQIIHNPPPRIMLDFATYSPGLYILRYVGKTTQTIKILKL